MGSHDSGAIGQGTRHHWEPGRGVYTGRWPPMKPRPASLPVLHLAHPFPAWHESYLLRLPLLSLPIPSSLARHPASLVALRLHLLPCCFTRRTPERMFEYARTAHQRGLQVIIAGAGGAAHLPGMVAAMTPLPVIGVPVKPPGYGLDGVDALLSIVQMPKGVPVATVAIGNAANAGLLAVRILASADPALLRRMLDYQAGMTQAVLGKAARLEEKGWRGY